MSREQNELRREIEEGVTEVVNQQSQQEDEDEIDDDDWKDEYDDRDDDWDEEDDWDFEDFLREEAEPLFFGDRLHPAEDVRRARVLLWGGEFGIEA